MRLYCPGSLASRSRCGAETSAVRRQNGDEEQRKAVALPSFITPKLVRYVCYRYGRLCKPCTFASLVRYSVGAAAKRPRDSEGSHHLRSDGRGTRRSHRERPSTPPAAGAGAERYGGPASNPKAEALSENLGCAHAHGCCESSEAELARRELLELVTAPDADVGGAIKLLVSQPRTSSSRRTRAVAGHLEYDSGEDASARVLFHRAAQTGSPTVGWSSSPARRR